MRKIIILLLLLVSLHSQAILCTADYVDPILLDEPNENVFDCKDDIFIELMEKATISGSTSGRTAEDKYLFFKSEILFLLDDKWNGLDKTSFSVKHVAEDGTEEVFPLDYAITMLLNLRNGWLTLSDEQYFTSFGPMMLVFDVVPTARDGWTLLFRPTERGAKRPYCEVEIPLQVR